MKRTLLGLVILSVALFACQQNPEIPVDHKKSGAAKAMEEWALFRAYPEGRIKMSKLAKAFETQKQMLETRGNEPEWEALGPKNIGGRTLCIAFHPTDPNIQYIGSASGGLWKTSTAGNGVEAWQRVPLGFPVLGVSSIAINPDNPDVMYIGTGEVYNYTISMPGIANRLTRGSYGMGVLKTADGGQSWEKTIDWSYSDMKGVWDIVINPENTSTVLVASTEGIYRTHDSGQNWQLVHNFPMGVDLEMHPEDTSKIFVSHGGYQSPQAGIFVSEDGGSNFSPVAGLPNDYTGKSLISISPSNPDIIYISIADALEGRGLYRSDDGGSNWTVVNTANVPTYQGWFAHDVAIKPDNPDNVIWAGVEAYQSEDGGLSLVQKTVWHAWYFGQVPVGGPEGPGNYAHADIHAIYYAPFDNNTIYMATDGGIFVSEDNGNNWEGRNGGYQSQQFYARFSSAASDSSIAMGGLQDNGSAIYIGEDAWVRVIGGDGMCTAIHPENPDILIGSYQRLNLRRSENGGDSFFNITPSQALNEARNFNGPFTIDPQNPETIYAGAQRLHRSDNGGNSWTPTSANPVDQNFENPILTIAVSEANPSDIMVGTSTLQGGTPGLFRSSDGGQNWEQMPGLPDRIPMEVVYHPGSSDTAYVVFSGFGIHHLYRTEDGGTNWAPLGAGLPDIPASSIVVDPLLKTDLYVATDLGVYASFDSGENWEPYSNNIAAAAMAMHLSISPINRKLRVATHGLGVYETDLSDPNPISNTESTGTLVEQLRFSTYPNPVESMVTIDYTLPLAAKVRVQLLDTAGRPLGMVDQSQRKAGHYNLQVDLSDLPGGVYYYTLDGKWSSSGEAFRVLRKIVKQ